MCLVTTLEEENNLMSVCLVSSLSAAHARLHWDEIYIVTVMKCKSVQVLCRVCYISHQFALYGNADLLIR